MKAMTVLAALVLVLASVFMTGAVGMGEEAGAVVELSGDGRVRTELSGGARVACAPAVSGEYDVTVLGDVRVDSVAILLDGSVIASGEEYIRGAALEAGREYVIEVSGEGSGIVEIMRGAAGRSVFRAASIGDRETNGFIARPGSVFWYTLRASDEWTGMLVSPEPGLRLRAEVYAPDGSPAGEVRATADGGCYAFFESEPGTEYSIRLWTVERSVGAYTLMTAHGGAPENIYLSTDSLELREGDMRSLRVLMEPAGVKTPVFWASGDRSVAEVTGGGVITAVSPGTAEIYAYGPRGLSAELSVEVRRVEPEYMKYLGDFVNVRVGDVMKPAMQVYPAAAAGDPGIAYVSDAPEVVSVSSSGEITALQEGDAVITAGYGGITASIHVRVDEAPTRYRALFISEQNYSAEVNSVRIGAVNSAYNLETLFSGASYDGESCSTAVEVDLTAPDALAAIDSAFAGAAEQDVSILYISCHGYVENGMTFMQFVDGSVLAACDLEAALRKIPGTIVILADFCDSGGLIGGGSELAGGMVSAFAGEDPAFASGKYKVLASAAMGQDSYRLGYADGGQKAITVFAWALCDAMGWDVEDQRRSALAADADYNGRITLWEACQYTRRRVMWYMSRAGGGVRQDVQIYPEGDMFTLFRR